MNHSDSLAVQLADRSYDIHISAGALSNIASIISPLLRSPRVVIVTDEHVESLYAKKVIADCISHGIAAELIVLPAGEQTKSIEQFSNLLSSLLQITPDRKLTLVALGGGVIGDITGFAASVLLRGVDFIQIPTTLLAQVDSSVGGKTGINTAHGKNLIGTFYQPKMVVIDTETLTTLPARHMRAGYAEILKYGLLGDADFYEWLLRHGKELLAGDPSFLARAIHKSCSMKAQIVAADERESGVRAYLNLGHTFGHALEAETGFSDMLLHGEAVAIGMVFAARLSERLGLIDNAIERSLSDHLRQLGMKSSPLDIRSDWNLDALMKHMKADKKAESGELTFIVLDGLGEARVMKNVPVAIVRETVQSFIQTV